LTAGFLIAINTIMKKVITLSILLISLFAFSLIIFAQTEDTITITTYYPSPYESYNYLDVEEKLGIGTKNPQAAIHIFNEENAADDKKEIIVDTINDTGVPKVSLRKARGTLSSPTAVTTGNWLGNYAFWAMTVLLMLLQQELLLLRRKTGALQAAEVSYYLEPQT